MSNGLINALNFAPLRKVILSVLKLWVKYDYQNSIMHVNNRFSLELTDKLYIRSNGERVIVFHAGFMRGFAGSIITGFTLGLIDAYAIKFLTTDKTVTNKAFLKELVSALNENIPNIERTMKEASQKRWGAV